MRGRRRRGGLLGALCLLAVLATSGAAGAAPALTVQGNRLLDTTTDTTFVPRGVDWPSFEYACQQGWGYSSAGTDAAAVALIAGWHINTVRVPLNQDCWLGDDGMPAYGSAAGYRAAVAQFVANLNAAGIVPVLDLHWSGPNGVVADGQRAMPDARSPAFWTSVATAFRANPSVMFDAFNEPYSRYDGSSLTFDLTWNCWDTGLVGASGSAACQAPTQNDTQSPFNGSRFPIVGMQQLVTAIRAVGAGQPILLGGLNYANDLTGWLANAPTDPDHALVASFHNYDSQVCHTAACWDAEIAPVAAQVPVVTGEFGETDCADTFDQAFMTWADAHGVGYLAWAWWVLGSVNCHQLAVISDASGTPQAPNGIALKAHLAALAASVPVTPPPVTVPAPTPMAPSPTPAPSGTAPAGTATPADTPTTPPAITAVPPAAPPAPVVARARVVTTTATLRGRLVTVRVACAAIGARCRGRLTVERDGLRLGAAAVSLAAGASERVAVTLPRRSAARVARFGHAGRTVTVALTIGTVTTAATVRLRGR